MFCPECRREYKEGFYTCRDCGVSLVAKLPPEPALESLEFEKVLVFLGPSDVAMIKSLLDSEGIAYYIKGESPDSDDTALMVRKDQVDEARQILDGLKLSEPLTSR
jgi:hypothetical protein